MLAPVSKSAMDDTPKTHESGQRKLPDAVQLFIGPFVAWPTLRRRVAMHESCHIAAPVQPDSAPHYAG